MLTNWTANRHAVAHIFRSDALAFQGLRWQLIANTEVLYTALLFS